MQLTEMSSNSKDCMMRQRNLILTCSNRSAVSGASQLLTVTIVKRTMRNDKQRFVWTDDVQVVDEEATIVHLDESQVVVDDHEDDDSIIELKEPALLSSSSAEESLSEPLLPQTEAYPVHGGRDRSWSDPVCQVETGLAAPLGYSRPEYLCVKLSKPSPGSSLGFHMQNRDSGVFITRIDRNGLLGNLTLREGDQILAINGVSCVEAKAQFVAKLIQKAERNISIVALNPQGDPSLVSSCVKKPYPDSRVGLCLKNDRGAIRISRIHGHSLFIGSLLMPGHRCIEINGRRCENMRSIVAAELLGQSSSVVEIISSPPVATAMVLSCETHRRWFRSVAAAALFGAGILGVSQSF